MTQNTVAIPALRADTVLAPAWHTAVEYFDRGALVLDLRDRTLTELDAHQSWILSRLDGQCTVAQVTKDYAADFALPHGEAFDIVQTICRRLLAAHFIRLVRGSWKGDEMGINRYVQNPDVNLREEDEDGALLFNPDTGRVQLLNSTGLYIWKLCADGHTTSEIIAAFRSDFDEVPEDKITADVELFISQMMDSGFIGIETA